MLASTQSDALPSPLTQLSDEERMFQSTVRRFAREQIAPHVREMDEAGVFRKDLIRQFFELEDFAPGEAIDRAVELGKELAKTKKQAQ